MNIIPLIKCKKSNLLMTSTNLKRYGSINAESISKDLGKKEGIFEILSKKEAANLRKELERLQCYLSGIRDMPKVPDIIIVIDQRRELIAIKEAISLKIPIISVLDTNCDPNLVDVPIPGNDDSIGSIRLILQTLGKNIKNGKLAM